jgi:hypothetical protein
MRWEDERYVRLYTRDTVDWLALSFEAQGLLALLLRKVDRAGCLKLGKHGKRGVAAAIGHAHRWETIAPALEELMGDGVVVLKADGVAFPNYIQAQECQQSDKARKQAQRERDRDKFLAQGNPEATSADAIRKVSEMDRARVTRSQDASRNVTAPPDSGHALSSRRDGHAGTVTPCRTVPPVPAVPGDAPPLSADPVAALGAVTIPAVLAGAVPDRRATPRPPETSVGGLRDAMGAAWFNQHGVAFDWTLTEERAVQPALGKAGGDEAEVLRRWRNALQYLTFPTCGGVPDLVKHWNRYGTAPPATPAKGRAPESAKYRADGVPVDEAPF